jgi:serpin B
LKNYLPYLSLLALLSGCPSSTPPGEIGGQAPGKFVSSSLPRDTSPSVSSAKVQELAASNREFAFALYAEISDGTDNLFVSPHSISVALAMAYAGAESSSETEIANALHFDLPEPQLHPAFNQLDLDLADRSELPANQSGDGFTLNIVNAMFGQTGYPFLDPFLDTLAVNYGAGMYQLDFEAEADRSRMLINDWVEDQTNNRIQDLLPAGTIDALTRLVLVNAIDFKASWLHPFDEQDTTTETFSLLDESTVSVPTMHGVLETTYGAGDGYAAVELPYIGGKLAMTVIVPEQGRFEEIEDGMNRDFFDAAIDDMHRYEVTLSLPKYSFSSNLNLVSPLESLGMVAPFSAEQADFTGMSNSGDLYISAIQHQAFVDVSEQGTEAAAATAAVISATSAPQQVELAVDRPFLFAIRDLPTGEVLFMGRVTDPS